MRIFTVLIFCLYMLVPTFAIAQQDESCDANPRWLLVTVVQSEVWMKPNNEKKVELVDQLSDYSSGERLQLVDRCYGDTFDISHYSGSKENIAAEINWAFYSSTQELKSWYRIWVKESLQDICQAMQDCADVE